MLTLLGEAKFWSSRPELVAIRCTDFGAFRYTAHKREAAPAAGSVAAGGHTANADPTYVAGKQDYAERRGQLVQLSNKRKVQDISGGGAGGTAGGGGGGAGGAGGGVKLRAGVQRLEEALRTHAVVHCRWQDHGIVRMMLANGLLVHVCVGQETADVQRLAFDRFFVGKLVTEGGCAVTDAVFTRLHILIAYSVNQLTFVHLQKPSMRRSAPEKIARMDPRIVNILINGPPSRHLARHLACNGSGDLLAVWTQSSQNEVYPWRPTVRDADRANVNVYRISRAKLEPICYYWTEHDPCTIQFSALNQNRLHSVEQNVSRRGDVTVSICQYDIRKARLQRLAVTAIPLPAQVACYAFSPDGEKLLLGCRDASTVIFDEARGITHMVRAAFVPATVAWHCDSAVVAVGSAAGAVQLFDISLACVRSQLLGDDGHQQAGAVLDLAAYLPAAGGGGGGGGAAQNGAAVPAAPLMGRIAWNRKPDVATQAERQPFALADSLLLAVFAGGPAVCVRFAATGGMRGDVQASGLGADVLIDRYLGVNQVERAINVLLCMNWDTYGRMCMVALHRIANYVLRQPLVPEREAQLQKALGSFLVPVKRLAEETDAEWGEQVRDLTRKFFQYLLRFRSFEKAFSLAIDINDEDLFMDLHNCAKADGHPDLAVDAYRKAEEIIAHKAFDADDVDEDDDDDDDDEDNDEVRRRRRRNDLTSDCSHSSCSECAGSPSPEPPVNNGRHHQSQPAPNNQHPRPPLPIFHNPMGSAQRSAVSASAKEVNIVAPYVPPLPSFSAGSGPNRHVRVNIPKLGLKVSAYSRRHSDRPDSGAAAANRNSPSSALCAAPHAGRSGQCGPPPPAAANLTADNVLLVDPPLPQLHNNHQRQPAHYRRTASQDNLCNLDVLPKQHHHHQQQLLRLHKPNASYSPESLAARDAAGSAQFRPLRIGTALPRIAATLQPFAGAVARGHMAVIDVVPNPDADGHPMCPWPVPDQTLGIPFPVASSRLPSSSYYTQYVHKPPAASGGFAIRPVPVQQQPAPVVGVLKAHSMYNIQAAGLGSPLVAAARHHQYHQHPMRLAHIPAAPASASASAFAVSQPNNGAAASAPQRSRDTVPNKVKFADTVRVALLVNGGGPDNGGGAQRSAGRKEAVAEKATVAVQQELADSLPLCRPDVDYLRDFEPLEREAESVDSGGSSGSGIAATDGNGGSNGAIGTGGSIKVVHFGVI